MNFCTLTLNPTVHYISGQSGMSKATSVRKCGYFQPSKTTKSVQQQQCHYDQPPRKKSVQQQQQHRRYVSTFYNRKSVQTAQYMHCTTRPSPCCAACYGACMHTTSLRCASDTYISIRSMYMHTHLLPQQQPDRAASWGRSMLYCNQSSLFCDIFFV